ncbi:hypothetical protein [Actinomadura kijaniata]|uniref:hypothetical protein n=1 Tax=Actinomadura kijaniata TaxID=46161 RepID=UPI00082DBA31|nr:hypothetical protein [Actinomadura kijaniata]
MIELDFEIKGYPGTGRRVELDSDLATVYQPDLVNGAFMGDAVVRLGDVDLGTDFHWLTMLDWCARLTGAVRTLDREPTHTIDFFESDDFLSLRRHGDDLLAACSYRPGIAVVPYRDFAQAVRRFTAERMRWLSENFPTALDNPAMPQLKRALGVD